MILRRGDVHSLCVQGFCYRMRFAYAHFPINASITGSGPGSTVEIRNFLGQRIVRKIKMLDGVTVVKSTDVKDQLELTGNDIELVSRSGAWLLGVGVMRVGVRQRLAVPFSGVQI